MLSQQLGDGLVAERYPVKREHLAGVWVLLHVRRSGDSGSPRVTGSTSRSSFGQTSGFNSSYGRGPALRRTLTTYLSVAPARASSRLSRTVLIAMPVAYATAATPP